MVGVAITVDGTAATFETRTEQWQSGSRSLQARLNAALLTHGYLGDVPWLPSLGADALRTAKMEFGERLKVTDGPHADPGPRDLVL